MNRCKTCLMPDTRPDTAFVDGVCSACISFQKRHEIDWRQREQELMALLHAAQVSAKARGVPYDVIVPSSGGKDSHYQAVTLKEMGARVLAVTATTCHQTPIGKINIENLAKHVPTIQVTPNMSVRRKLNRIGLEQVGDISWPEHAGIWAVPFQIAVQMGIPLIFYGECPQEAYGGPLGSELAKQMDERWVSEFGGFLGLRPSDIPQLDGGITAEDMAHYRLPPKEKTDMVRAYFLGQFIPWDSHRNAAIAQAAGMTWERPSPANWWPHENLDNAQTGLHDHLMYRKYGYGRLCAQLSVDIRMGKISREHAHDIVLARDGAFPTIYAGVSNAEILRRLGMSVDEMLKALHIFTNQDLFETEQDGRPILK